MDLSPPKTNKTRTQADRIRRNLRKKTKKDVRERDGNRCVKCNDLENLTIHHIVPVSEAGKYGLGKINKEDNLVVLCDKCHIKIHRRKRKSIQFFSEYIKRINKKIRKQKQIINNEVC